jgi:eukaryotic-like serine/threonine-protein kinase
MEPGTQIGRYRLLREIGRGGMGTVYLAVDETAEPRREVAIKILRDPLHSEHADRFLNEQRLLASLDHPGIARFFEGGTAPDGRPFLVMEYVPGEPIAAYCDRRRLSVRARLHLFRSLLEAVAYAHRQLVVHRDIKPRNVLVTDDGAVKLVDFGIAKPLLAPGYSDTETTQTRAQLMTPEYASPEQVTGGRVTTATDVYALGLLLYELLCGRRAQRLRTGVPGEIERIVVREEVPRPSAALDDVPKDARDAEPSAEQIAAARRSTPSRLARQIRGDLDRIVGMALRKEPERRYASASLLGEDIERFLDGRPVRARGDSARYRATKFVTRHRVLVTAAAALLVMLVGYLVMSLQHAAELRQALDTARREAAKAEQVSEFMIGLFESHDPESARGAEITGRELLERGVARADELSAEPVLQAQLLDAIGGVYRSLGEFARARPLLARALALRREALGDRHADVAQSRRHLGVVLRYLGEYEAAAQELEQAVDIDRALTPDGSPALAASLHELGHTLVERNRFDEAEALLREGLDMRRTHLGPHHVDVAESLSGMAYVRSRKGFPRDAVPHYQDALEIRRRQLGTGHPQVARSHQNLAVALSDLGEYAEAERHYAQALEVYRTVYGEVHPSIAVTINNLANLKARQDDLEAAERLFRQTLEMRRALFGEDHPSVVRAINNLATVLMRLGRPAESETMFRTLIARFEERGQGDDPELTMFRANLSEVLRRQGKLEEAESIARRVLALSATLATGALETATNHLVLGRILRDQGRAAEAERHITEALAIRRERLGAAHPEVVRLEEELGQLTAGRVASP